MPPKRRLSTSESTGGDENDGSGTKRKKLDEPGQIQAVLEFIKKFQKRSGGLLCEIFMKIPGKLLAPGYTDIVKNPITIPQIQQKFRAGEYPSIEEFKADFYLIVSNAKEYYLKEAAEHRIALELEHLLNKSLEAVANGDELTPSIVEKEEDVLTEFLEELLGTIMTASDASEPDRNLSSVFQLLPSKRRYPEYYKVTTQPIDLKMIACKIQDGEYSSIGQMEEDLQLMFRNATNFNEPGSIIYKDAKFLSKLVKSKKTELDVSLQAKQNRGARSSRRQSKQVFSSQLVSLQYEDSETEDEEEEEEVLPMRGPLWEVYSVVRDFTTPGGIEIAEAFLSLPSKRELPDYYQTIMEPISLNQIKRKIRNGEYKNSVKLLAKDMDLMFENCKEYNRPDSKLYKDGAKLQKVMRAKVDEIEGEDTEVLLAPTNTVVEEKLKSPRGGDPKEQIRKRCKTMYNAILNYTNEDNERPIGAFMEKPDRKYYPDYYDIIDEPMDMKTINEKIMTSQYKSDDDMLADCKLMFSNCRMYNEEGSEIYETANTLEKVLMAKARDMGIITEKLKKAKGAGRGSLAQKIKMLYDTLKDFRDAKGRQLSLIFLKLPSKHEYPDYYDIIKRPIDMEKISGKIRNNTYECLEDAVADFTLVFDNACKYNEPDSQIYKDAQSLQRLAHQTVRHLTEDDGVPDARTAVQDILSNIYHTVFTAQDGEERCLADSFAELPEHDEINGKKIRALSLEIIKRRTDRGLYKRLDLLQRDVFTVLTRARKLSRLDSQVWEDSVELQRIFIRARDQYGEKGARLLSKVYDYTPDKLEADVEAHRASKANEPQQAEEEEDKMNESGAKDWSGLTDSAEASQYHVGDFVYVTPEDPGMESHIFHIERLFERDGGKTIWARQFFRQRETFHVPTRTFFEKEVMQGDLHSSIPISKVQGKCIVMAYKDYFKTKPEGFEEKDIFVCEWRYTSKIRNWKKIKPNCFWDYPSYIKIVQRDKPVEPKKIASVFKDRIEKHKEEVEEIEALEKVVEEPVPPNIKWQGGPDPILTYWEQYTIPGPITVRRGDHVLVRGEGNRNMVAQIDTMWMGQDGMAYFNGPWFVVPAELPPQPDRKFFKAEAFLSTISDSNPLLSVVGKCVVLEYTEFCKQRPTQYNESDVYICESLFDEAKRLIRPLPPGGLKKYVRGPHVQTDEVYFFPQPLIPEKESIYTPPPPQPLAAPVMPTGISSPGPMGMDINEDSMDAPSIGSVDSASMATIIPGTPGMLNNTMSPSPGPKKKDEKRKKLVTAYILFSMDQRRITMEENPGVRFGEISRTIAEKWKQLSDQEKKTYQERAKKYNEEKEVEEQEKRRLAEIAAANAARNNPPPASSPSLQHPGAPGSPGMRVHQESGGVQNGMPQMMNGMNGMMPLQPHPNVRADPLFHVVPPKPQRLLHSEAYIKYIEGLSKDTKTMCNWDKQLQATNQGSRLQDESKLPASWLSSTGEHTTSTEALWALRDFMMHESLGVVRLIVLTMSTTSSRLNTENVAPQNSKAKTSSTSSSSSRNGSSKKLQTLQPSAKNHQLLVGRDGMIQLGGGKKKEIKIYQDPAPPAHSSTPEQKKKNEHKTVQATVDSVCAGTQVEETDTAQYKAEVEMYGAQEELSLEYWKELAEKRREALEVSLTENESLHTSLSMLEEENERIKEEAETYKSLAEQAQELASILNNLDSDDEQDKDEDGDNSDDNNSTEVDNEDKHEKTADDSHEDSKSEDKPKTESE